MKPADRLKTAEAGNGSSRRELLTRAGLLAGAAGAAGVVGSGRPAGAASSATFARTDLPTVIRGADWRLVRPGVAAGTLPSVGSIALPLGRLVNEDGAHIGMFESSVMPTSGKGSVFHQLTFEHGTIAAVGPSTLGEATFAVIGGTGQFAGASGSYRLRQQPAPSGGTAEFTLDITASGGRND